MSKLQRLRDNVDALEFTLAGISGNGTDILSKYTGFGGLGFVLNPLDTAAWAKSDLDCFCETVRLHRVLRKYSADERKYNQWMDSLKSSTLTAFYTPREIPEAIFDAVYGMKKSFYDKGITPKTILDPAAGTGVFLKAALMRATLNGNELKATAYENDLITGAILSKLFQWQDIRVQGFETIPQSNLGTFDIVATNVPFGNFKVYDPAYTNSKDAVRRDAAKMIHRYYVLKGLDTLRNGGIEAFIITGNYLNRDSEQLREALKGARLVSALRLANNLFREAGTEVGTDLLILQKDESKGELTAGEQLLLTAMEDNGCPTNAYFLCYPDHVIATSHKVDTDAYGKPGLVYHHKDGVKGIAADMKKVLDTDFAANIDIPLFCAEQHHCEENPRKESSRKEQPKADPREAAIKDIFETYKELYEYEAKELTENTELRKKLNQLYDDFVEDHGPLNTASNRSLAKRMKMIELLTLEECDESGAWGKADIMLRPIAFSADDLHEAKTPTEALAASLNDYGKPDMRYMMALTAMDEDELLEALSNEVFYNPLKGEYEIRAKFVAGDVVSKLNELKEAYPQVARMMDEEGPAPKGEEGRILHSMRALREATPAIIPFEDLDFNLGERWIKPRLYGNFASEFFSMPGARVKATVSYNNLLDQFTVYLEGSNEKVTSEFRVTSEASSVYYAEDLLTHALHNTCPKLMRYVRDKNGNKIMTDKDWQKEEDPEAMQLANAKIEEIRQGFVEWLQAQPKELRDELERTYNRRFNCFVRPKYDGSHQTFPGIDMKGLEKKYGVKSIYDSQKDCVWMLLLNGGGICDHEVGSGKTLIMCMTAHEMKRLGLCHKPMIIGLKANVGAIAETYRTAYPKAKILYAKPADYSGDRRLEFLNRAKNNDYDCIIMSHDQFSRIPQSEDMQLEIMQDEVAQLDEAIKQFGGYGSASRKMRRGLELRKRNMQAKVMQLMAGISERKDDFVDFGLLGVDHIFVDESHQFKNLGFSTRHDRVAGMGNTEGSKRAFNLLMAIRTIQKRTGRDLGATFLSGTTVTNSLTELYCLFKYLRPKALERQNISCFDAWAAIFTKKSTEFEFSITNTIVQKERFRYFIKVPELAMFYNEITDFRTAEDVGIERPKKHAMLLNIKPTPDQEEFIKNLMEFARTGDPKYIGRSHLTDKEQTAKMLIATDLARKMSLDMRLIDPSYEDHPRSKASRCAALVSKYYHLYDAQKGTQLVFSDLSTWQNNESWSVYGEIKKKLVEEYGIPANEIRFIQECKSERAKERLIEEVNEGRVRVLFGSTSMLGTGVNAQKRVVAVHHLDTPWRPSDLEQRDGRAVRKGNEVAKMYADNKVDVIIYAVERSLDSYKFNLLHCKQTFINQLKRGQLGIRTIDEGTMDENGGMNFGEYMAVLSGNTDLLERAKLEKRIGGLESERKSFFKDQRERAEKRKYLEHEAETYEKNIELAQADLAAFNKAKQLDEKGNVVNTLAIDGFKVPETNEEGEPLTIEEKAKLMGERLFKIADTARTYDAHLAIGSIYGFRVVVNTKKVMVGADEYEDQNRFFVEGRGRLFYSFNDGKMNRNSARLSAGYPLLALLHLPTIIGEWQAKVADYKARMEQLDSIAAKVWPKEEELRRLRSDLAILDRKIETELSAAKERTQKGEAAA